MQTFGKVLYLSHVGREDSVHSFGYSRTLQCNYSLHTQLLGKCSESVQARLS